MSICTQSFTRGFTNQKNGLKKSIRKNPDVERRAGRKFRKAWNEVIQEKSAEDPLFKEVYASYSAFREKYAIWGDRAYLK